MPLTDTASAWALKDADDDLVLGTCMLGNEFGEVESASLTRSVTEQEIEGCDGNLRALILKNPMTELQLEVIFPSSVGAPGIMESIGLPLMGYSGRITNVVVNWTKGDLRKMTITAKQWDALATAGAYKLVAGAWAALAA